MNKRYKIRSTFVFFIFCLLYAITLLTLFLIQIKQNNFFSQLGEKQYNIVIKQTPPRAPIFDRSGRSYLALNKECTSAFILPKKLENLEKLKEFLAQQFPQALARLMKDPHRNFMYIERNLSDKQLKTVKNAHISDIHLLNEPNRFYPVESAGHIVGLTDIDNHGLFGIELSYNKLLAGSPTTFSLEKDARSGLFYFKKETKVQGKDGKPIKLTIDSDLQFLIHEAVQNTVTQLQAKEGAALIMNPQNGDILAMVCVPTFNPNKTKSLKMELTKNKIITETYELGSVIKVCAALAALEEGIVRPDDLIDCENRTTTYIDGRKVNTTPTTEAGIIPFSQVIKKSNNIGIAKIAKQLDTKLYDHYLQLGFGKKTGIAFPGERSGYVNPPEKWSKQSIFSLSYGYEISGTLLQLAKAFSIIANNGYQIQPRLILDPEIKEETINKPLYSPESIDNIKKIMETSHPTYSLQPYIEGYRIMTKTGTANSLVNGTYVHDKNIFTCAGIIEKDNYSRVIVVFIKEIKQKNLLASRVASPLFEIIAKKTVIHDKII